MRLGARWWAALLALATAAAGCLVGEAARAAEEPEAFARVVVAESLFRSGPGVSHRVIHVATRGETFAILGREGPGFWLRVQLSDGRVAYALGDTVEPISLDEDSPDLPARAGVFAPPVLTESRGGLALLGGLFDRGGYVEMKPAFVLAPQIALEPYAGIALSSEGRRFLYGGGGTLNFAPDWVIAPYVHLGAGGITTTPNQDASVLRGGTLGHARAGGGLLVSFRFRILLRLEVMHVVLFDSDFKESAQSFAGGLGTYF